MTLKKTNYTAVIIFAILAAVFFLPAIIGFKYFAPTDIVRNNQPFHNDSQPHNQVIGDVAYQFLPWFKLSKDFLKAGHFPFWNIYSGGGLPLFANMQAAVLFPLTWLFYIFNFKIALLLFAFIKLFLFGFFSYLFLKELKLKFEVCLIGGTAFMFANTNVIWLLWPLSSVLIFLPLNFYLVEKIVTTGKKHYLAIFTCSVALSVFAGHPQTLFYMFFATGLYFLFRVWVTNTNVRLKIKSTLAFGISAALGIGLSAVALLPFLEYLKLSENLVTRQQYLTNPWFLQKWIFITNLIPDFFGNPAYKNFSYMVGYSEQAMGYIGITLLLLALYALIVNYKNKSVIFFTGLLFLAYCLIYKFEPIYWLINKLPGFSLNYNHRFQYVWAFAAVVLGCLGLNEIISKGLNKVKFFIAAGLLTTIGIVSFLIAKIHSKTLQTPISWHSINNWQNFFFLILLLNLAAAVFVIFKLKNKVKWLWVLLVLVFFETGIHGIIFNTASGNADFFPTTGATAFLANDFAKNFNKTFSYDHIFLPNLSTWYGFNQVTDYDAFSLKSSWNFKKNIASFNYFPEYTFDTPNINALEFFGVKNAVYPRGLEQTLTNKYPNLPIVYQDQQVTIFGLNPLPRAYIVQANSLQQFQNNVNGLLKNPDLRKISFLDSYELQENGTSLISYHSDVDTYLMTNENYYPDWQAKLDNQTNLPVLDVLGFKAIKLPTGQHSLQIFYHPNSFYSGLKISLVCLFIFVLWMFYILAIKNKGA